MKDVKSFDVIEPPQMMNLTRLKIRTYFENFDAGTFFTFLERMARLKSLDMNFIYGRGYFSAIVHEITFLLSCAAVVVALTKNKNFVLKQATLNHCTTLKITNTKTEIPDSEIETLHCTINRVNIDTTFIEKMKRYVRTYLGHHWAVTVNVEQR